MADRPDLIRFQDLPVTVLTDWTRDQAKAAIDQHDLGYFGGTAQLSEAMLRDDRISSVLETRILGLLGCDTTTTPPKGYEEDEQAKEAAERLEADWQAMLPDDVLKGLLRWAVLMRFCLAEICWSGDETHWTFTLKLWHPMFVWYDIARRQYVVNTQQGPQWIEPGKGKWFLWAPDGYYRGWILGAVRSLADPWLARTYNFRDWARYCEVHGLPIRKIKAPAQAPEPEKDAFFNQVAVLGSDNTIICPQGVGDDPQNWDLELVEAEAGEWEAFKAAKEDCDTRISIRVLGQNLTTEVQGGAYAAAQVHNLVRFDYKKADAKSFATALREQCFVPWTAFNYGDGRKAPVSAWAIAPPDDLKTDAETASTAATAVAALQGNPDVDTRAFLEKFKVPLRAERPSGAAPPPDDGAELASRQGQHTHTASAAPLAPPASVAAQRYVEDAAAIARDRAAEAIRPDVEALIDAIGQAKGYDEIRTILAQAGKSMDPAGLARVTEQVLVLSQLAGRHAVATDHQHDKDAHAPAQP